MIVWSFVGIPWVVPANLGMANVLEKRKLLEIAHGRSRPPFSDDCILKGEALQRKTYAKVQNAEVQATLRECFSDFASTTWAVVFGYSLAGTSELGVFKEQETQLLLASAIAASGGTRQAKSHMKGAMSLGVSVHAVKAVLGAAHKLNKWNNVEIAEIDAEHLYREINQVV
jgi:hypothetical protein